MTPDTLRETYYFYTGKASDINRQLIFAGIAIIWLFKTDGEGQFSLPIDLLLPAKAFILALILDILQYIIAGAIYGLTNRYHEWKGTSEDSIVSVPVWFNWPGLVFFYSKVLVNLAGYLYLYLYASYAVSFL